MDLLSCFNGSWMFTCDTWYSALVTVQRAFQTPPIHNALHVMFANIQFSTLISANIWFMIFKSALLWYHNFLTKNWMKNWRWKNICAPLERKGSFYNFQYSDNPQMVSQSRVKRALPSPWRLTTKIYVIMKTNHYIYILWRPAINIHTVCVCLVSSGLCLGLPNEQPTAYQQQVQDCNADLKSKSKSLSKTWWMRALLPTVTTKSSGDTS